MFHTSFQQTSILYDTCDETEQLFTETSHSTIQCGFTCLRNDKCRRMLVCEDDYTVQCTYYYDGDYCVYEDDSSKCTCYKQLKACTDGKNCTCPLGYYGDTCDHIITDCSHGFQIGMETHKYKLTTIKPPGEPYPYKVICQLHGMGWTKIMSRENKCNISNFNRNWTDYEEGFGHVQGTYWLGLKKIYKLLQGRPENNLNVLVYYGHPTNYKMCTIYYDNMALGNASTNYWINLDKVASWSNPFCGDSLLSAPSIKGRPFSTYDHDSTSYKCPTRLAGGWWYADDPDCLEANINGRNNELNWVSNLTGKIFKIQMSIKFN
ncbi:hypothetical protein SNE40_003833 [Patella caerulea]|uniref:Fibrinogen C-terminal domain-containing protein n=1 Tax=Patella caerulea TaxID=87958 RepID=A0AAN8K3R9_PATCE